MRSPILSCALLFVFAFLAPSAGSAAPGWLEVTWGEFCSPIVTNIESPAAGPLPLVVSVIGNDESHSAYRVAFYLANQDEVNQYLEHQQSHWQSLRQSAAANPSPVAARLRSLAQAGNQAAP